MEAVSNQTEPESDAETASRAWLIVAAAAVRTTFGVFMAIDAWLKWQPGFAAHYVGYLQNAANAQPRWLEGWFHMWLRLVTMHTGFFITTTRLIETAIAIGLSSVWHGASPISACDKRTRYERERASTVSGSAVSRLLITVLR